MSRSIKKRFRTPSPAKPGELKIGYQQDQEHTGVTYLYGAYGAYKADTVWLMQAFENVKIFDKQTLVEYLKQEGFDLTTLKFSIQQVEPRGRDGSSPPGDRG